MGPSSSDFLAGGPGQEPRNLFGGARPVVNNGVDGIHNRHVDAEFRRQRMGNFHREGTLNDAMAQMQALPTVLAPITRIRKEELA